MQTSNGIHISVTSLMSLEEISVPCDPPESTRLPYQWYMATLLPHLGWRYPVFIVQLRKSWIISNYAIPFQQMNRWYLLDTPDVSKISDFQLGPLWCQLIPIPFLLLRTITIDISSELLIYEWKFCIDSSPITTILTSWNLASTIIYLTYLHK